MFRPIRNESFSHTKSKLLVCGEFKILTNQQMRSLRDGLIYEYRFFGEKTWDKGDIVWLNATQPSSFLLKPIKIIRKNKIT